MSTAEKMLVEALAALIDAIDHDRWPTPVEIGYARYALLRCTAEVSA